MCKKIIYFIIFICFISISPLLYHTAVAVEKKDQFKINPVTNNNKKWRIAYYQGGANENYQNYLLATIKGLMELGWVENQEISNFENTNETWNWLANNSKSNYIEFVKNGFYSANWDSAYRQKLKTEITDRLNKQRDIDLVLVMGTWAGTDLANNAHSTPTLITSVSDPIQSGITKSFEDSGLDHVFIRVDPYRYERQVRIFHNFISFKKLGIAYENSIYGKSYAALDLIEKVAKERGFEIVSCFTISDTNDQKKANDSVIKCFNELANNNVGAIYVTVQGGVNKDTIHELAKIANDHRIPTFSQAGSYEVKEGFFMSISRAGGYKPVGLFLAATIAKIFNGAKPRQLNQVFEEAPYIAINLKTAELIGQYLNADILAAADELYRGELQDIKK